MISVIIPTFNEAVLLPATLASLQPQSVPHDLVVVDAGSIDGTTSVAQKFGALVIPAEKCQRAGQMNTGARASHGEVLLFLHADTKLAPQALNCIAGALQDQKVIGGGFARRYDSASPILRLTCALAEARTRYFGWFLGDQAMFVRRTVFENLGSFPEWDIFEDLDFSRRMAQAGRVVTLRPPVISAGRRFTARGALWTTGSDLWLTVRYLKGGRPPVRPSQFSKSNYLSIASLP